jgi:hypothetical protein
MSTDASVEQHRRRCGATERVELVEHSHGRSGEVEPSDLLPNVVVVLSKVASE